jgi:hypothetical protein
MKRYHAMMGRDVLNIAAMKWWVKWTVCRRDDSSEKRRTIVSLVNDVYRYLDNGI